MISLFSQMKCSNLSKDLTTYHLGWQKEDAWFLHCSRGAHLKISWNLISLLGIRNQWLTIFSILQGVLLFITNIFSWGQFRRSLNVWVFLLLLFQFTEVQFLDSWASWFLICYEYLLYSIFSRSLRRSTVYTYGEALGLSVRFKVTTNGVYSPGTGTSRCSNPRYFRDKDIVAHCGDTYSSQIVIIGFHSEKYWL